MDVDYKKLWKLMIDKDIKKKTDLIPLAGITTNVLAKLNITGSKVTAIAVDGYKNELNADYINDPLTIIAIEKDKEVGKDGTVWVAPCSDNTSGSYAKEVIEIIVE